MDEDFAAFARERQRQLYRTAYLLCADRERAQDGRVVAEDTAQGANAVSVVTSLDGVNLLTFTAAGPVDALTEAQWTAFGSSPTLLSLYRDAPRLRLDRTPISDDCVVNGAIRPLRGTCSARSPTAR